MDVGISGKAVNMNMRLKLTKSRSLVIKNKKNWNIKQDYTNNPGKKTIRY